jgi:beta-fructofuranosidase
MSVNVCGLDAATCALHGKSRQFTYENDSAASTLDGERMLRTASLSRPSFHVTAPNGWLNDPCGPGYDPTTGMYHLFFQWNPHGNDWGNMSWGHATSSDCVSWKTSLQPALLPSANYDRCGVFTGCLLANDIHGNSGDLTVIYTSVNRLPIHYTLPYVIGSESLSLAASSDGGRSWERQECNPILPGPPQHLSVTGWRDPSLATWSRGEHSGSGSKKSDLYGLISGGIVGKTPTVFLYKVNPTDLREWEFAGPLVNVGLNFHPSRWSGDFGVNWEVVNLMTLTNDSSDSRDFGIVKVEGGLRLEGSSQDTGEARHKRHRRGQHWMSIKPSTESGPTEDVLATYAFSGIFDHGCFYAANSFWDPQTSQNVVYGWFTEEDLPNDLRHRQGWSGMVSLPRVVRLTTFRNVKKARTSPLRSITSIEMVANAPEGGKFSIHTLGISPDPRLSSLRPRCKLSQALGPAAVCPSRCVT